MKKQVGLTLIELMISMVLGLIVIAGAGNIYLGTVKSSGDTIKSVRLSYDLSLAMSLMNNDIKRAGYWSGAHVEGKSTDNPYTQIVSGTLVSDIQIFNLASPTTALTTTAGDCILYSYDATGTPDTDTTGNGTLDTNMTPDASDYYGFRLNTVTNDDGVNVGVIQIRTTGTTTGDCTDGNWETLTDENMVNITAVQFSFAPLGDLTGTSRCMNNSTDVITNSLVCNPAPTSGQKFSQKRIVNIQLTGNLIDDSNAGVTKTLQETVKVRNNRISLEP